MNLQDAILADALDELSQVHQSIRALPVTLQTETEALTHATQSAHQYLSQLQTTAERIVSSSIESTKAELAASVAKTANDIAHQVSRKRMIQWATVCFVSASFFFAGFGYLLLQVGIEVGYQNGVATTLEYQKKSLAWSESVEGQMAFALTQTGSLRNLYTCDNPGWVVEVRQNSRFCLPKPEPKTKQTWGWQLP